MRASHAVVGGWAAGCLVLALVLLFVFTPAGPVERLVYIGAVAIVAGFGLAVLLTARAGRVGAQRRQPRSASAAVFAVLGFAVGLLGFAFGWWVSLFAVYPLGLAAWLLRGERLRPGARPWPVALDDAEPVEEARFVHHGSSLGAATAVPADHAAHGPPRPPPPPPPPSRPPPPSPSRPARRATLLLVGWRAVVELLRGRRR